MLAPPLELRLNISSSLSLGDSGVSDADVPPPPPPCSEEALRSTESPGCRVCWEERGCSVMMSTWAVEEPSAPTTDAEGKTYTKHMLYWWMWHYHLVLKVKHSKTATAANYFTFCLSPVKAPVVTSVLSASSSNPSSSPESILPGNNGFNVNISTNTS